MRARQAAGSSAKRSVAAAARRPLSNAAKVRQSGTTVAAAHAVASYGQRLRQLIRRTEIVGLERDHQHRRVRDRSSPNPGASARSWSALRPVRAGTPATFPRHRLPDAPARPRIASPALPRPRTRPHPRSRDTRSETGEPSAAAARARSRSSAAGRLRGMPSTASSPARANRSRTRSTSLPASPGFVIASSTCVRNSFMLRPSRAATSRTRFTNSPGAR